MPAMVESFFDSPTTFLFSLSFKFYFFMFGTKILSSSPSLLSSLLHFIVVVFFYFFFFSIFRSLNHIKLDCGALFQLLTIQPATVAAGLFPQGFHFIFAFGAFLYLEKRITSNITKLSPSSEKQQKELEIQQQQPQQNQHTKDMFQTAGYPQPPPSQQNGFPTGGHAAAMTPIQSQQQQQYAQAQAQHQQQQQMLRQQQQQQQQAGMFNPNIPSSSRAGQMSSSATAYMPMNNHPHGLGPPMNMYGHGQMPSQNMTAQQHSQMQAAQGSMMQSHGNQGAGWNGMYHPSQQHPQNMFPYGQQRPFIPPQNQQPAPQPPAAATTTTAKKTTKRKNARANQEQQQQQQQQASIMQQQAAATSQQHQQPPSKQQFLNPMNGYNGSPQFSSPSTPMNHLSPFHHQQQQAQMAAAAHQQQQQQQNHFDWGKNAGANRPNSRSEQVRADLRATIQTRQNTSPQQLGAIMSPNETIPARFTGPNSSISPPTMMSPPRVSHGSHPGHASQFGPSSIPQPSSATSEQQQQQQQTGLFSPKQNGFYNYPPGMQQQQHPQQAMNPQQQQQHQHAMAAAHMQNQQQYNLHQQQQQQHQQQQQMQLLEELKAFPAVTLDDCKEILQEDGYGEVDLIGFDMMNKQGFDFNYDESRALLQRILY